MNKLTLTVRHFERHLIPERKRVNGDLWTLTDCTTEEAHIVATYRLLGEHEFLRKGGA